MWKSGSTGLWAAMSGVCCAATVPHTLTRGGENTQTCPHLEHKRHIGIESYCSILLLDTGSDEDQTRQMQDGAARRVDPQDVWVSQPVVKAAFKTGVLCFWSADSLFLKV